MDMNEVLEIIKEQAAKGRIQVQFGGPPAEPEQEVSNAT